MECSGKRGRDGRERERDRMRGGWGRRGKGERAREEETVRSKK